MTEIRRRKYFGFVWPSRYMESSVVNMACNSTSNLIFDLSHEDVIPLAERLREIGAPRDTVDLLMLPADIGPRRLDSLATDSITNRIWVDMSAGLGTEEIDRIAGISKSYQAHLSFIPIVCSIKSIFHILKHCPELQHIALKGNEAAGFVGSETSLSLLSTVKNHLSVHPGETSVYLWGGIGTPEAAAAVLGFGVSGIVFESLHWLTDLTNLDVELGKKIMKLRPDYTEILGSNLQVSVRLFNKGNSKAVRDLKAVGQGLCSREVSEEKRRQFIHEVSCRLVQPLESNLSTDQIIPLGIEASFCGSFVKQFGQGTGDAIKGFVSAAYQCLHDALEKPDRLKNSPAIAELGTRYAIVQGAMSWITDEPDFAAKVAHAGALPTIALGVLSPQDLEQKLGSLADVMAEMPYAVNVITLDENPYRASHFEWIMKTKPNFVVIAAGDPSHASRFLQQGIEVIYVSPTEELLRLAFNAGVKFVVCEGNEAGGHVGPYSTLTLAQRVLELRRSDPDLFQGRTVILAGGIFDRDTAFCAAVLGADAVQVGTAYLATEEIVTTGALSKVYQKEILRARPGDTVVTGEVVGLRVRSLGTPKIESLCELERQFYAGTSDEASFRREVEALTAGSLYTAAKARNVSCGAGLEDEVCASEGQFMSGSSAGLIQVVTNLEALHRELVAGPSTLDTNFLDSHRDMVPTQEDSEQSRPSCLSLNEGKVRMAGKGAPKTEPIVITAMSLVNSLGDNCNEMLSASLAKKSGIVAVPISRWDHSIYYDPRPRVREKTYCNVGAFLDLHISRKELGIAPHDFRTMTGATKITMLLAHRVIEESGILDSDIPRDRISVLISQNSGEAAGTLPDMIIRGSTDKIVQAAKRVLKLEPEQERELENEIKKGRLGIDDTTLLGRLNCSAGGFICNKYGFMGPSFSVSAACATSLVALYTAVQLIHNGIIDAAVVGGGEEYLSPMHFMEFSALGALAGLSGAKRSPRETSRPFEIGRDGMVLGEGGGMLVVERESVAQRRGVRFHAYVTSMGASNNHLGMVESSSETQELAIAASFKGGSYGPEMVDFIECHATGTRQGDVEEVRALRRFHDGNRQRALVLSSFKSQIGHTLGASGINSLIRGVLAMQHGVFPPTINYEKPDPDVGLERAGMVLLDEPAQWSRKNGLPRRMQVNAFGFGGSNYVVQIEETQNDEGTVLVQVDDSSEPDSSTRWNQPERFSPEGIFFFEAELSDQPHRVAVLAEDENEAVRAIQENDVLRNGFPLGSKRSRALARQGIYLRDVDIPQERLAFVFPGQGSHYAGMGKELYENVPVIRSWMDRAATLADFDLLHLLFYDREEDLQKTRWQQPALFTLEYAMVQYLVSLGISPTALAGHSLGELTALCLAGVYSFEDGFRLVNKRAVCMDKACSLNVDPGVMLACDAPLNLLKDLVKAYPQTYVTNVNSPRQTVVGGQTETVRALGLELKGLGFRSTLLPVSMAFHSPIMNCIHDELEEFISTIEFHHPHIPVVSNTTARPFPADPAEIKRIVMAHLESPVLWLPDINVLRNEYGISLFVEVGPREILSNLIKDTLEDCECIQTCLPSAELLIFKTAVAQLYSHGYVQIPHSPLKLQADFQHTSQQHPESKSAMVQTDFQKHLQNRTDKINDIIQQHVNAFVLESFGRFIKPAILKSLTESIDPTMTEDQLDDLLRLRSNLMENPAYDEDNTARNVREIRHDDTRPHVVQDEHEAGHEAPTADVSPSDITETVIKLIMEATGYERDEIEPTMDLREDLSIRSSRLPVIMDSVESHFGIKIELEDFMDVRTIQDISDRIAMVIERQAKQNASSRADYPREMPTDGTEREKQEESEIPLRRVVFREVPVIASDLQLVEINPTEPIIVIAPNTKNGLAKSVGDILRRDYGANICTWGCLGPEDQDDPSVLDLRNEAGVARAVSLMHELPEPPAGLVLVLDGQIEEAVSQMEVVSDLLSGMFEIIRVFLQSAAKRFVLVVHSEDESQLRCGCLFEGLIGVLLAGALELGYVLFRAISLSKGAQLVEAIRGALNKTILPVRLVCRSSGIYTMEGHECPLIVSRPDISALEKGDVVVFSGGGYGITSNLATRMASYGCRVVLLGRTSLDSLPALLPEESSEDLSPELMRDALRGHNPDLNDVDLQEMFAKVNNALKIRDNMRDLQSKGLDVSYFSCDVTDQEMVLSVFDKVIDLYGRIDGVVHGAGILKDNLIKHMNRQDFHAVIQVKFAGAWNLFKALRDRKVKFFACLSSAAAIQGNLGQSNYAAGNRMMSALLSLLQPNHSQTVFKALMLPPIEGLGMAETTEIRSLMKRAHIGYLHVEELTELFWREILLDTTRENWVLLLRTLPDLKTAPINTDDWKPTERVLTVETAAFNGQDFPMIDAVPSVDLKHGFLHATRTFSRQRDLWIGDHKPFLFLENPLVSAIMVIETMLEACAILHPLLKPVAVRDIWFFDVIECPPDSSQEISINCRTVSQDATTVTCQTEIFTEDAKSLKGTGSGKPHYKAQVVMGSTVILPPRIDANLAEFDSNESAPPITRSQIFEQYEMRSGMKDRYRVIDSMEFTGGGTVKARSIYKHWQDFSDQTSHKYHYPPYLLEALMQASNFYLVARDPSSARSLIPYHIGELIFTRNCTDNETLIIEGRVVHEGDDGITWEAHALDQSGEIIMIARKVMFRWFAGSRT